MAAKAARLEAEARQELTEQGVAEPDKGEEEASKPVRGYGQESGGASAPPSLNLLA